MSTASCFWWNTFKSEGSIYECPRDANGQRIGPLVAYAGQYEPGKHYVGDIYVNMAVMERSSDLMVGLANHLVDKDEVLKQADVFCGAPEGGKTLGVHLARNRMARYAYPDQEVISGTRQKKLAFLRHDGAVTGKSVVIVEDVMNNFSTTRELVSLINEQGGKVVAIAGLLNRSNEVKDMFDDIPVFSVVRSPQAQYRQDDRDIAEDIARVGLVLKPKQEWQRLREAMKQKA